MSRIYELIRKLSPDGVTFKAISDFATCSTGATPATGVADYWNGGTIPWMNSGEVNKGTVHDTDKKITRAGYDSCSTQMLPPNVVVIALAGQGKTRGLVARTRIPLCTNQSLAAIVTDKSVESDFLYHYLRTQYQQLRSVSSGDGTRGGLNLQMIRAYRVPVPSVEAQREIVRVLDLITTLEAELEGELEAELEARRTEYGFHRDQLLTLSDDGDVRRLPLGDFAEFKYGYTARAQGSGDYRFIRITDINALGKLLPTGAKYVDATAAAGEYVVKPGDLLMARTGATYGKTVLVGVGDPAVYASFLIRIRLDRSVMLPSYYWHFAQSSRYWSQANAMVSTGGQPQFNANVLRLVEVPVPSLSAQARAVAVLDRFDALVNDLSIGLSAELNARRQQYEHYRDRLLTFKELSA